MSTEMEVRSTALEPSELTIEDLTGQVRKVQQAMEAVMKVDEHYGVIPGTNKPTLLKPGAEKLCLLFRLAPRYAHEMIWHDDGHLTVIVNCKLQHITSGNLIAEGEGMCSSREEKYAYRRAQRVCPSCGEAAIIKGKEEYGGGWVCFKKKGGCGAKYADGVASIEDQPEGQVENPNLPDTHNTVLKMACKRALVAAVLNGTAASDIFTQDLEDLPAPAAPVAAPEPPAAPATREALDQLYAALSGVNWHPDWQTPNLIKSASRRFGRPITDLRDLTDAECQSIIAGAEAWAEKNPKIEEGEIVET